MSASPVWLFDLDDTLHDAGLHVFPHIHRSMGRYIASHLGLSTAEAAKLREHYWRHYGATLLGMMKHHGTDPRHFLWHTHQFDNLASMLVFEPSIARMLRRLPGRKIVFSNAPRHYALSVLREMGLMVHLAGVSTIEDTGFKPKPAIEGFRRLLRNEGLAPGQCILVEDTLRNLRTAARLGMKTVWVSRAASRPSYVDARIGSILELPRVLSRLLPDQSSANQRAASIAK